MNDSELDSLRYSCQNLLARLSPSSRRRLACQLARDLQKSQSRRISAQKNPDYSSYVPRKRQSYHKTKRLRSMFGKLRTTRHMKANGNAKGASVFFSARSEAIATIHHFGQRGRVKHDGPKITYPRRELLGLSRDDREEIEKILRAFLMEK